VRVEDYVILGGFTLVHQFCRLGAYSFCAFGSHIAKDVLPYVMVAGQPAQPHGLNTEGLRRRGVPAETIARLREAYKTIYRQGLTLEQAKERLAALAANSEEVATMLRFLEETRRSIVR
jgi:UDP-N-acetylglucosamine acyltransferase